MATSWLCEPWRLPQGVILTPEEGEGLCVVRPRSRLTGIQFLLSLPFGLLEAVLRSHSISGWAGSFGRGKSSKPDPLP